MFQNSAASIIRRLPGQQFSDRSFNPIWNWREISTQESWGEELSESPFVFNVHKLIAAANGAVKRRGEIVEICSESGDMTVTSRAGTTILPFPTENKEAKAVIERDTLGFACDEDDNVYVLQHEKTSENMDGHTVLYILDEHYSRVKHKSTLHFLSKLDGWGLVSMAINKNI